MVREEQTAPAELTDAELEVVVGGKQPTPAAPTKKPMDKIKAKFDHQKT